MSDVSFPTRTFCGTFHIQCVCWSFKILRTYRGTQKAHHIHSLTLLSRNWPNVCTFEVCLVTITYIKTVFLVLECWMSYNNIQNKSRPGFHIYFMKGRFEMTHLVFFSQCNRLVDRLIGLIVLLKVMQQQNIFRSCVCSNLIKNSWSCAIKLKKLQV